MTLRLDEGLTQEEDFLALKATVGNYQYNDLIYIRLKELGYSGSLSDMIKQYRSAPQFESGALTLNGQPITLGGSDLTLGV